MKEVITVGRKNLKDAMESTIKAIIALEKHGGYDFDETIKEMKVQVGDMAVSIKLMDDAGL